LKEVFKRGTCTSFTFFR